MTVSYQYEVASSTSGGFTRLLFMWKGSLYKLIYRELLLFLLAFGILSALYRNLFTVEQKRLFEKVVVYCDTFINLIPLSFVLGFYVAYVAARWWNQYLAIPWPDKIMHSIALYVHGVDDHARMTRRSLMRYLNLTLILVLRSISSAVKRRFPKLDHLVEAGFMTPTELQMYQSVPSVEFNTYWIPCTWFIHLLREARRSNRIADPQGLKIIMEEFNEYRSQCGMLWSYDWVSIPLVYTQVVTIATYSFFLAALVGRQFVEEDRKAFQMEIDIYLPVFTILQFFFYMGLLKVAEQLINPFGDDDEDFELNWLIDRHTKVSYLGVDTLMTRCPPLVKDMYFNEVDLTLPYTEAAVAYKRKTYRGSVHNMIVPEEQHAMFLPEIEEEEEEGSVGTRTPKTSILSLHKVGLGGQTPSPSAGSAISSTAAGTATTQHPVKGHKPAETIWRRNSDKGRRSEGTVVSAVSSAKRTGGASGRSPVLAGAAAGVTAGADGPRGSTASAYSEESESPAAPRRNVLRSESLHSWKSFFSSLSRRDRDSSSPSPSRGSRGSRRLSEASRASLASSSSHCSSRSSDDESPKGREGRRHSCSPASPSLASPAPGLAGHPGRPRLQSCPKLLVLVGRHDSTGSTGGRKKGVRWKPVLDEFRGSPRRTSLHQRRRRGSDDDGEPPLCRGCRARMEPASGPFLRRPTVRARAAGVHDILAAGSAPDLSSDSGLEPGFVRDGAYWRGGKFPGTGSGLTYGQRSGSRGILKKMMFWRGSGSVAVAGDPLGMQPYADSVVVNVDPSPAVTRSLPDIAAMRSRPSLASLPSLACLTGPAADVADSAVGGDLTLPQRPPPPSLHSLPPSPLAR